MLLHNVDISTTRHKLLLYTVIDATFPLPSQKKKDLMVVFLLDGFPVLICGVSV